MLHLKLKSSACPLDLKLHRKGQEGTASEPRRLPPLLARRVQAAGLCPLPSSSPRAPPAQGSSSLRLELSERHALAVPGAFPSRRRKACLPYFTLLYHYFVLFPFVSPSPDTQSAFLLSTGRGPES
ncbi:unnamed protein product [Rangifer tarandus platyrhynchus]|uniref:Uncharacterized protein n=1 Tax=Rangifer tarandus platyrhynchus TaxID=3082113 RepID=A0AC59ZSN2_RANTA